MHIRKSVPMLSMESSVPTFLVCGVAWMRQTLLWSRFATLVRNSRSTVARPSSCSCSHLPRAKKPEHLRSWAAQDRTILMGVVKTCYWCRPSIFGLVAHHLARGYDIPKSAKQIPHGMQSRRFTASITEALRRNNYSAPDQTPIFWL